MNWAGQTLEKRSVVSSADATGYHKVLASLDAFKTRLADTRQHIAR